MTVTRHNWVKRSWSAPAKSAWMWSEPSPAKAKASGQTSTSLCRRAALMLMWIPTCCRPGPVHSRATSRHALCDVILGDRLLIRAVCVGLLLLSWINRTGREGLMSSSLYRKLCFCPQESNTHYSPAVTPWNKHQHLNKYRQTLAIAVEFINSSSHRLLEPPLGFQQQPAVFCKFLSHDSDSAVTLSWSRVILGWIQLMCQL